MLFHRAITSEAEVSVPGVFRPFKRGTPTFGEVGAPKASAMAPLCFTGRVQVL
jgi:hypothetical protein